MKYIRKEISKGVKPIADQDFKITGDIDITGNYLQNGSPFSSFDASASNTFTASQKVDVTDNSNPAFTITQKGTGDALLVEKDVTPNIKLIDSGQTSAIIKYNDDVNTYNYQSFTYTTASNYYNQSALDYSNNPSPSFFAYKTQYGGAPNLNYLVVRGVAKSITTAQASTLQGYGTITLTEGDVITTIQTQSSGNASNKVFTADGTNYTETTALYPAQVVISDHFLSIEADTENSTNLSQIVLKVDNDNKLSIDSAGTVKAWYALNVAGTTTLTGNTSIGGDVAVTGDEIKISSGGAPGSNPIPYLTIESLAVGTSYPVQQPQPGGGIKWIHNSTELASIQLASGVDNTLEINSTVGVNFTNGSITLATATNNWKIEISGTNLIFSTGGVNKMKLDASGNLTVVGDVTAFGTI